MRKDICNFKILNKQKEAVQINCRLKLSSLLVNVVGQKPKLLAFVCLSFQSQASSETSRVTCSTITFQPLKFLKFLTLKFLCQV